MKAALLVVALAVTVLADGANVKDPRPFDTWQTTVNGVPVPPEKSGRLIWSDEFDFLDHSKWQHEKTASGGGNWEFQIYQNNRTNSYTKDGNLYIMTSMTEDQFGPGFCNNGVINLHGGAPADECTNPSWYGCERTGNGATTINPTLSARMRTVDTFSFKYGTVEARAKMPRGDWLWPAIWMLPKYNAYGGWPASGEIDLVESRGNRDLSIGGVQIGEKAAASTLHYGPFWPVNGYEMASFARENPVGYGDGFHLYKVEWTPENIRFYIDNELLGVVDPGESFWTYYPFEQVAPGASNPWVGGTRMAPFDQEFYLIVNVATGGTNGFFPDEAVNGGPAKPWRNDAANAFNDFLQAQNQWQPTWQGEDAAMQVDYIRVYAL